MESLVAEVLILVIVLSTSLLLYYAFENVVGGVSKEIVTNPTSLLPLKIENASWFNYEDGLILYYTFDDLNGLEVVDLSGNRNSGRIDDFACSYTTAEYGGHYYEHYSVGCFDQMMEKPDWVHLYQYCKSRGGYIAVPQDEAENNFLKENFGTSWLGVFQDPDDLSNNKGYPEGCPDDEPGGCWKTVPEESSSYRNWSTGEPNNAGGHEDCAEMRADGYWNDRGCFSRVHLTCESTNPFPTVEVKVGQKSYAVPTEGVVGSALLFDGIDDYVITPEINFWNGPFTILFFYKLYSKELVMRGIENPMLWGAYACNDDTGKYFEIKSFFGRGISISTGSYLTNEHVDLYYDSGSYQLDKWLFAGFERNGSQWRLYFNGNAVQSANDTRTDKTVCFKFLIGYEGSWGNSVGVRRAIDEVRIYDKPLDDETVENLYYRLQLFLFNPNDVDVNLDQLLVTIGNDCAINLEWNKNYIDDRNSPILPAHSSTLVKIAPYSCSIKRGMKNVCVILGSNKYCYRLTIS